MNHYTYLTQEERNQIFCLLKANCAKTDIANTRLQNSGASLTLFSYN